MLPVSPDICHRESSNLYIFPGIEQLQSSYAVFYFLEAQLQAAKEEPVLQKTKFDELNQEYNSLKVTTIMVKKREEWNNVWNGMCCQ